MTFRNSYEMRNGIESLGCGTEFDYESVGVCAHEWIASGGGEAMAAAKGERRSSRDEQRCGFGNAAMRCLC